jgi:hypothetical protein
MKIYLEFLNKPSRSQEVLRHDGWVLHANPEGEGYRATHPVIRTETDARLRFARLGLLTSSDLRIEFQLTRTAASAGAK